MKNKKLLLSLILVSCSNLFAQPWQTMIGNTPNSFGYFGTTNAQPIRIKTNGIHRALFTTGSALSSISGNNGDGLRILDPIPGGIGHLDLLVYTLRSHF
jgi:hypothetical protein